MKMLGMIPPQWWTKKRFLVAASIIASLTGLDLQPYRAVVVSGISMSPTYSNREVLLATRNTGKIERGDVVVFQGANGPVLKRVALVGGDHFFRFKYLSENHDMIQIRPTIKAKDKVETVYVPEGTIYVLGDNLSNSEDSRVYGFVPVSRISGKLLDQRPTDNLPLGILSALSPINPYQTTKVSSAVDNHSSSVY